MLKSADKESPNATRLLLGYDGGCLSCYMLAQKIRERVGDKLEVQNLRDVHIREWRKEALGEDAPWGPTLFEVSGERVVRAWTGLRMGLALTRALGPGDTWQVMQAIGEMRPTKEELLPGGFSRGSFLKGVGGAALAVSMLSGTGKFARPAVAHGDHREFKGSDLVDRARNKSQTQDVRNVAGREWVERMANANVERRCLPDGGCLIAFATGTNCHLELVERNTLIDPRGYCSIPKAMKHQNIQGGDNGVLKVSWAVPKQDWLIVYYQYDRPFNPTGHGDVKINTMAKLYKTDRQGDRVRLVRVSINGKSREAKRWD